MTPAISPAKGEADTQPLPRRRLFATDLSAVTGRRLAVVAWPIYRRLAVVEWRTLYLRPRCHHSENDEPRCSCTSPAFPYKPAGPAICARLENGNACYWMGYGTRHFDNRGGRVRDMGHASRMLHGRWEPFGTRRRRHASRCMLCRADFGVETTVWVDESCQRSK